MKYNNWIQIICRIVFLSILNITCIFGQDGSTITDSTDQFLDGDPIWEDVASVPPAVDFKLVPLAGGEGDYSHWCNVVLGPDDRYYFAVGDHQEEGTVLLIAYDPNSKNDEICINSQNIFGLKEGKWHGRPDINPNNGIMFLLGFYNGNLIRYNIYSKQVFNLGKPVSGEGFPEHTWDWERNRLYVVGHTGKLLVYDTENSAVIFHDNPPDEALWNDRARLLDRNTGCLYGSDQSYNILKYDPSTNQITTLESNLEDGHLRAWSNRRESDGFFWIFNDKGSVFKFNPEQDDLKYIGKNLDEGSYVSFIERSPGGRYLYYSPANIQNGIKIIQYDTQTNKKKILAFLRDYYLNQYDYDIHGFYGGALSRDGKSFFLVCNGIWAENERPAMFHIHIPVSERVGETVIPESYKNIPLRFSLYQNYPNPFNPKTVIRWQLPVNSHVNLSIYNILGQKVVTLINEKQQAGIHQVEWNVNDLTSGVYYSRIHTGDFNQVKKMLLIK